MDILIKGMEMPKKCYSECPFCDDRGDYPRCIITGTQKGYLFIVKDIRMEDCPLVALPEHHGRLGDLDRLKSKFDFYKVKGCWGIFSEEEIRKIKMVIDEAPTIVEATE